MDDGDASEYFEFYFLSCPLRIIHVSSLDLFLFLQFDVPKTNIQSRYDTKVVGSYFPELLKIARERGLIGLYSGLGPTLLRAFPANAALFLGVEMSKKLFDNVLGP